MFLLSMKAGMRAVEIASITWAMVTDAEGKTALVALHKERSVKAHPDWPVIHSERDHGLSAAAVAVWFHRLYTGLGMVGCSSHSGRRSFVMRAARRISEVGGSLRDVQMLAGHASLSTTAKYIEHDAEAQRKVVAII
jgi:integrase/recombinase XerD